jgi:hypothetical protein
VLLAAHRDRELGSTAGHSQNFIVSNGKVQGMGGTGINIVGYADKVFARSNGSYGIRGASVTNCTADFNGNEGIFECGTAIGSTAFANGSTGIDCTTVATCESDNNGGVGIKQRDDNQQHSSRQHGYRHHGVDCDRLHRVG